MPTQKQTLDPSVYQLKVTLNGSKPPIWRRIQVTSDTRLNALHDILQVVMGWENYHLHQFMAHGVMYGTPDPEFDMDLENEESVTLGQVISHVKEKLIYEYDFGDSWEHEILLEKILSPKAGENYPICVTGKRACPPEDCGGIWGYYDFLEAIGNSNHPEHEEMLEWVGEEFNPEAFDRNEINQMLKQIRSASQRFGHLPPRYAFVLNPYKDARFTKCPQCDRPTRLRKFALLVHVDDLGLIAQGKTCRFCPECEMLIVHQDELEAQLAENLSQLEPQAIGNDYLVTGTIERKTWRRGLNQPVPLAEMLEHAADFEAVLQVESQPAGWYRT